jgi:hypothetical protein
MPATVSDATSHADFRAVTKREEFDGTGAGRWYLAPNGLSSERTVVRFAAQGESHPLLLTAALRSRFQHLAEAWHTETDSYSQVDRIVSHPAYLEVVAMGDRAVPWILSDLASRGGFWFAALQAITKQSPGSVEDQRKPRLLREAWLRWGRQHNYLS